MHVHDIDQLNWPDGLVQLDRNESIGTAFLAPLAVCGLVEGAREPSNWTVWPSRLSVGYIEGDDSRSKRARQRRCATQLTASRPCLLASLSPLSPIGARSAVGCKECNEVHIGKTKWNRPTRGLLE